MPHTFVLIHSPLVGPETWVTVADELRARGAAAIVPALRNDSAPYWQRHAVIVASAIAEAATDAPIVLVAHSGAGPALPAMRGATPHAVAGYVFVDAPLPRDGASRLDLFDPEDAAAFRTHAVDGMLPPWGEGWPDTLWRQLIPSPSLRARFRGELQPAPLAVYEEPLPVPAGWPDAPCAYVRFSIAYEADATEAERRGWRTERREGLHLHMLVDPQGIAALLLDLADVW